MRVATNQPNEDYAHPVLLKAIQHMLIKLFIGCSSQVQVVERANDIFMQSTTCANNWLLRNAMAIAEATISTARQTTANDKQEINSKFKQFKQPYYTIKCTNIYHTKFSSQICYKSTKANVGTQYPRHHHQLGTDCNWKPHTWVSTCGPPLRH